VSVAFDTLKFARALQGKAKLSAEQAEGISEAFADATGEQLATATDLRDLSLNLRAEIASVKSDFRAEIAALKSDLRAEIAGVKSEVLLLKWMVGFNLATTVAVIFLLLRR
jgi:hypothetical protein